MSFLLGSALSTARTYTLGQAIRLEAQSQCRLPLSQFSLAHSQVKHQYCRLNTDTASSSSAVTPEKAALLAEKQDPHESARERLRPLIETFEAPIDYAVAYGSGVIHQANRETSNDAAPLTDLIVATPSAREFHKINIRQNPSHYPLMARMVGSRGVAWLQENWGARIWYVTMVKLLGKEVKYGVISTESLSRDLSTWETLYIAGRLQKPHLPLLPVPPSLTASLSSSTSLHQNPLEKNLRSALSLALVVLPTRFTELELYEQIAGISYAGDPRMSVPGAENPEKVKNIVRGEGALEGFRAMYGNLLSEIKEVQIHSEGEKEGGDGEVIMTQPSDPAYIARLLLQLPHKLLHPVARHYRPTIVGSLVSPTVKEERDAETIKRSEVPLDVEFWEKVASQERIKEVVMNEVRGIIRRPALTQSVKGLFTAGFTKSFWYSLAKFRKWLKARQAKAKLAQVTKNQ